MNDIQAFRRPALAYFIACCAAVAVIVLVALSTTTFIVPLEFADIAGAIPYFVAFVAALALVPTVLATAVIWTNRLPRGLAETALGALIGLFLFVPSAYLLAIGGGFDVLSWVFSAPAAAFAIAGAIGGLTFCSSWVAREGPRTSWIRRHADPALASPDQLGYIPRLFSRSARP